ncbi:MAG TPA: hypothetical protein VG826_15020 [Pirellulales bacterium]|nr:hypothetical protein [Pirellulales bacterium]
MHRLLLPLPSMLAIAPFSNWDGNHNWPADLCRKLDVGLFGPAT